MLHEISDAGLWGMEIDAGALVRVVKSDDREATGAGGSCTAHAASTGQPSA
jgi:hypothetical protein